MPASTPSSTTYRSPGQSYGGTYRSEPTPKPDPLATQRANGGGFAPVDTSKMQPEIRAALKRGADVPGRVQDGPTCGLYALGMVMDHFDNSNSKNLNPYVQKSDGSRASARSRPSDSPRYLFDVAKGRGFTTQGEMFHASQLAQLAREFGYRATVKENVTLADLKGALDKKAPVLVAFDVDNAGNPGLYDGKRAHWAVVEGHFRKDGVDYVVATHGWTGHEYVWRAQDLLKSMNQLNSSDFPGAPKDIRKTLRSRMVVLEGKPTQA